MRNITECYDFELSNMGLLSVIITNNESFVMRSMLCIQFMLLRWHFYFFFPLFLYSFWFGVSLCVVFFCSMHITVSLSLSLCLTLTSREYHVAVDDKSIAEYILVGRAIDEIISNPKWLVLIDSNNAKRRRSKLNVKNCAHSAHTHTHICTQTGARYHSRSTQYLNGKTSQTNLISETEISKEYLHVYMYMNVELRRNSSP